MKIMTEPLTKTTRPFNHT